MSGYDDLCFAVFQRALASARGAACVGLGPLRGPLERDWEAGPVMDVGGTRVNQKLLIDWLQGRASKPLCNWLLVGPEQQMARWANAITHDLFHHRLPFDTLAGWRRHKGAIREHAFRQFLDERSNLPVLLWATPLWFLNTNPLPESATVDRRPARGRRELGASGRRQRKVTLYCGNDRDLSIPDRLLSFYSHPEQSHRNGGRPQLVKLPFLRKIKVPGEPTCVLREEALALACPGGPHDEPLLRSCKLPVHWDFFERGPCGPYLRERVVTLAKLEPAGPSCRQALVHSLILFFCPEDGRLLELATATGNDFTSFVQQHPGLRLVLARRVQRRP